MQLSTSAILSICDDIFNPDLCHQLARRSGFIQRSSSKINGHEFIKVLIVPSNGLSNDSLNGLCDRMREFNPEANISAPALAQRINTKFSVNLIKTCFEQILQKTRKKLERQYSSLEGVLASFKNIYMQDSTIFEINKTLSKYFPGTKRGGRKGGSSCKSQMKIDLIHNFATGEIQDARIYKGKLPDQALAGKIESMVEEGDLVIRDLGYFKIKSLEVIDKTKAFFLTRFPSHIKVYLNFEDKEPIDLAAYLNKHYRNSPVIDLQVWISAERLKTRLIAYRI